MPPWQSAPCRTCTASAAVSDGRCDAILRQNTLAAFCCTMRHANHSAVDCTHITGAHHWPDGQLAVSSSRTDALYGASLALCKLRLCIGASSCLALCDPQLANTRYLHVRFCLHHHVFVSLCSSTEHTQVRVSLSSTEDVYHKFQYSQSLFAAIGAWSFCIALHTWLCPSQLAQVPSNRFSTQCQWHSHALHGVGAAWWSHWHLRVPQPRHIPCTCRCDACRSS